jgi:hypothetical protein
MPGRASGCNEFDDPFSGKSCLMSQPASLAFETDHQQRKIVRRFVGLPDS